MLDGLREKKSVKQIAAVLYGEARVAADWHPDGDLRSRTKRRIKKARALKKHGYRDLAAGRPLRLTDD